MALVNSKGKLMANFSQVVKVFTTKSSYDTFVNNLADLSMLDAFCIFQCWERPYILIAEGKTIVLAEEQTNTQLKDIAVGETYNINDMVANPNGKGILWCHTAVENLPENFVLEDYFKEIAQEYAEGEKVYDGMDPLPGALVYDVDADGGPHFYLIRKRLPNPLTNTNTLQMQSAEFVVDLQKPHTPEIPDFAKNHAYAKHEAMTYEGMLYRAREAFVSSETFDTTKFELISRVIHALEDFVPNHHYAYRELVSHDNQLWAAKAEFDSGAEFDENDWIEIGQSDHIFFYSETEGYPERSIVISGADAYVTLKETPAGTALTDEQYYRLLTYVPQEMTQAEFDALTVKPIMAVITDSIYDMHLGAN